MSTKRPVNVDLGAKAELSLQIKTEVPSSSTGRLVDALTDAIRPFTEKRGLKADQIRLQREEVMIQIAHKAHQRLRIEKTEPQPIPNRILVPLLEKASLTDGEDEALVSAWANILASASTHRNENHALFVDILSKVEASHLRFLEFLAIPNSPDHEDAFFMRNQQEVAEWLDSRVQELTQKMSLPDDDNGEIEGFALAVVQYLRVPGSSLIAGAIAIDGDDETYHFEFPDGYSQLDHPEATVSALESLNVIRRFSIEEPSASTIRPWVEYVQLTVFGYEFFYAAHSGRDVWTAE